MGGGYPLVGGKIRKSGLRTCRPKHTGHPFYFVPRFLALCQAMFIHATTEPLPFLPCPTFLITYHLPYPLSITYTLPSL
jgi:hypothetical protein